MVHAKRRRKPGRLSERVEERLPSEGTSAKDLVGGHAEDGAFGGSPVQDVLHGGVSAEVYLRCTCRHGLEQLTVQAAGLWWGPTNDMASSR
jgi:hypothetical protein